VAWPLVVFAVLLLMSNLLAALALAAVIAGEAPGCPLDAKLAVAHVAQRNDVWYGSAEPTALDLFVALNWQHYPDPTGGAAFLVHPDDVQRMPWLVERTAAWTCAGTALEAWK